jgi:hypothetical protein
VQALVDATKRRSAWSVERTLKVLGVSRSSYDRWRATRRPCGSSVKAGKLSGIR